VIIERLLAKLYTICYVAFSILLALDSRAKSLSISCHEVTRAIGITLFVTGRIISAVASSIAYLINLLSSS